MADLKISQLDELVTSLIASGDWVPTVDVSDTSMAATGTTKKIDASKLVLTDVAKTLSALQTFSGGIEAAQIKTGTVTLSDNASSQITPVPARGMMLLWTGANSDEAALIDFRAESTNFATLIASGGATAVTSGTTLSGTTGADNFATVSAVNGSLWLENRHGSSRTFRYIFFG